MKTLVTILALVCIATTGSAQEDTTSLPDRDTLRIGNMIIIRSGKDRDRTYYDSSRHVFRKRNENRETNWGVVDLGFNQINDQTDYTSAIASGYLPAGASEDWFDQRNFKSTNVNIWIFMQRLNLINHVVNLKYGVGLELNNYKYSEPIKFQDSNLPIVMMQSEAYRKNKLAADYLTIPLMLNFNFNPKRKNSFGFSVGVSGGYLYSARQKTVGGGMGKKKYREDFDLRDFKFSYIGEIGLGPVRLYGSYAMQSMFENTLDQTPFNFGLRLSHL